MKPIHHYLLLILLLSVGLFSCGKSEITSPEIADIQDKTTNAPKPSVRMDPPPGTPANIRVLVTNLVGAAIFAKVSVTIPYGGPEIYSALINIHETEVFPVKEVLFSLIYGAEYQITVTDTYGMVHFGTITTAVENMQTFSFQIDAPAVPKYTPPTPPPPLPETDPYPEVPGETYPFSVTLTPLGNAPIVAVSVVSAANPDAIIQAKSALYTDGTGTHSKSEMVFHLVPGIQFRFAKRNDIGELVYSAIYESTTSPQHISF